MYAAINKTANIAKVDSSFRRIFFNYGSFVYDELLTQTTFLKNLMSIRRAKELLIILIELKLNEIQQAQQAVSS
jgi:hypothetical protein